MLKYDVKGWRWGALEGGGAGFSPRFLCRFLGWSRVWMLGRGRHKKEAPRMLPQLAQQPDAQNPDF